MKLKTKSNTKCTNMMMKTKNKYLFIPRLGLNQNEIKTNLMPLFIYNSNIFENLEKYKKKDNI